MSTVGIDPRQGLHKNLDLLSAYNLYQKDWPLYKPSRLYTSAINSPLFRRIEETLKRVEEGGSSGSGKRKRYP